MRARQRPPRRSGDASWFDPLLQRCNCTLSFQPPVAALSSLIPNSRPGIRLDELGLRPAAVMGGGIELPAYSEVVVGCPHASIKRRRARPPNDRTCVSVPDTNPFPGSSRLGDIPS